MLNNERQMRATESRMNDISHTRQMGIKTFLKVSSNWEMEEEDTDLENNTQMNLQRMRLNKMKNKTYKQKSTCNETKTKSLPEQSP